MQKQMEIPVIRIVALLLAVSHASMAIQEKRTYIVHMNKAEMPASFELDHTRWYESSLKSVAPTAKLLYTYKHTLNGFSASFTPDEAQAMNALPDVLYVMPDIKHELHTTRTPWFLGLDQHAAILPSPQQVSNVIIGVIDSGVWPESKSFDDTGLGPIPSHWRGECEIGEDFNTSMCNRKLVGARFFLKGYEAALGNYTDWTKESRSPRDNRGHGTHTATTAAGSAVSGANLLGYAEGTARGMVPQARIAMYKACWLVACVASDILAAMEQAIDDNVNVLLLSIAGAALPYYRDIIAIGAFSAMEKGILVSCSAGNSGPNVSSLSNDAPWITTVGAGTLDRDFPAPVTLGNGKTYFGTSLYNGASLGGKFLPFVYAGNVTNDTVNGHFCLSGTLIREKVEGKIVLCERGMSAAVAKGLVVKAAGGAGMILANTAAKGEELVADAHLYLSTAVGQKAGQDMKKYLFSNLNPKATIHFQGTKLGVQPSPVVAAFSSRGPSKLTPGILKPDLIAPGVHVLAGWTGDDGPTSLTIDTRRVSFNIISGTSMSCPHVSGLAVLLKAAHPDWSPAAIRSALMTTAYSTYQNGDMILDVATGKPSTPFDLGAGHVNPVAALNPGLVYDLSATDYLNFLCAIKYNASQIKAFTGNTNFACKKSKKHRYNVNHLNYPSFAVSLKAKAGTGGVIKHKRTLTNVGPPGDYEASIVSPSSSVKITVFPKILRFNGTREKKSYTVKFRVAQKRAAGTSVFGRIEWSDGKHVVRSPVALTWM